MTLYLNNKKGLFHATCEYQNSVYIVKKEVKLNQLLRTILKAARRQKDIETMRNM